VKWVACVVLSNVLAAMGASTADAPNYTAKILVFDTDKTDCQVRADCPTPGSKCPLAQPQWLTQAVAGSPESDRRMHKDGRVFRTLLVQGRRGA
jgi:hypothetical protein